MAIVAGNILGLVPALVPERESLCFFMAGKAFCGPFFSRQIFGEAEYAGPPSSALLYMRGALTVAGLTALSVSRTVGNSFFGMNRFCIAVVLIFMAAFARNHPHIPRVCLRTFLHKACGKQHKAKDQEYG